MREIEKGLTSSLINNLLWVVGLLAAIVALWQFYLFMVFRDSRGMLDAQGGGHYILRRGGCLEFPLWADVSHIIRHDY